MYSREELNKYSYFQQALEGRRITDVLDPLTGLVSKTHMIGFVNSLVEEKIPFTFGMIDLDNFKYINDTYGHSVGDLLLAALSNSLRNFLEDYGIAGRFGGDEFLFINFRDLVYDDKKLFCQKLFGNFQVLRKTYHLPEYNLFVTGTAGLASCPEDAQNYNDLFILIDKLLYRGKSKGRNCYIIYTESKHKNIQVIRTRKNSLYDTFKNLAAAFDTSEDLQIKLKAGFESLQNDLHITNLYFIGNDKTITSILDNSSLGKAEDIDALMKEEMFATNEIEQVRDSSPLFYKTLAENEIETVLVMRVSTGDKQYGCLMCAEPHNLRIWQENECAVMFFLARILADFLHRRNAADSNIL